MAALSKAINKHFRFAIECIKSCFDRLSDQHSDCLLFRQHWHETTISEQLLCRMPRFAVRIANTAMQPWPRFNVHSFSINNSRGFHLVRTNSSDDSFLIQRISPVFRNYCEYMGNPQIIFSNAFYIKSLLCYNLIYKTVFFLEILWNHFHISLKLFFLITGVSRA